MLVSVEVAKVKLVEVAELMVRDEILLLKVVQSAEVSSPRFEAEAEGKLKAIVFVLVEIEKSVPEVEEAKVKLVEVALLIVRNDILLLNVVQSAEVSSPLLEAEASGR